MRAGANEEEYEMAAAWENFEQMKEDGTIVTVKVEESVKAGVVTHLDGVRAFIPASQLSTRHVDNLDDYVGKEIDVKVITAEEDGNRLVLSGRAVERERQKEARQKKMESIKVGAVLDGKVETIKPYGAFIDLGDGVSGLVHISQISQKRVESVEAVLKEGQDVKVKVIGIKDGKISLSMKALEAGASDRGNYRDDTPDYRQFVQRDKVTTNLGDLLKNIKLDN